MPVYVGVIGLNQGAQHVRHLRTIEGALVVAVADVDGAKAGAIAAAHGARAHADWRSMLDGEADLDAVVLATPAKLREGPIEAIAARGLALFCEKPPALDLGTARRVSSVIESAGILNTVGFQFRWNPIADRLKALLTGRPRLFARILVAWPVFQWVTDGHASPQLWRKADCGGPLVEQAIHYQDVLRYVTGDEPVEVQAAASLGDRFPAMGRDCEETTVLTVRHASGMLTSHVHNWSYPGALMQMQFVGPGYDLTWHMQFDDRLIGSLDGQAIEERHPGDMYRLQLEGFVRAVAEKDAAMLRSPYPDALRSLSVCVAAAESVRSGRSGPLKSTTT